MVVDAQHEALTLGHDWLGTEHLLLGVLRPEGTAAVRTLAGHGVHLEATREGVRDIVGGSEADVSDHIPFTARSKKLLLGALDTMTSLGHSTVEPHHLLLALLQLRDGVGYQALTRSDADLGALERDVVQQLVGPDE